MQTGQPSFCQKQVGDIFLPQLAPISYIAFIISGNITTCLSSQELKTRKSEFQNYMNYTVRERIFVALLQRITFDSRRLLVPDIHFR
jgi:hypothetical protein